MPVRYFATLTALVIVVAAATVFLGAYVAERMQVPAVLIYGLPPVLLILALLIRKR